jgi:cytochrome b
VGATALTGWLQTTDAFWGSDLMEDLHEALATLILGLVALHLGGVLLASLRHGENLVHAMLDGRKRPLGPHDRTE